MANIQRRTSKKGDISYSVQVRRKGYPAQSKTFPTLQQAEDWAYDTERDIRDRRIDPRALADRKTVSSAIDKYIERKVSGMKSARDLTRLLNWWKSRLGTMRLSDLTPVMIDEALDALDCSGPTQNRYLGALSGALTWISRTPYNWIQVNPCRAVSRRKEHKSRERIITPAEWKKLIAYVEEKAIKGKSREKQLPTFLRLAYATGRRRSELLGLTWDCVDLDEGLLYLLDTKTGHDQVVPIDAATVEMLEQHRHDHEVRGWKYVFRGRLPNRATNYDDLIREAFRALFKPDRKGELPVFHSIRHTAATELGNAGATEAQIMSVTGHSSSASVNRYVKKTVEAARAAQALRGS